MRQETQIGGKAGDIELTPVQYIHQPAISGVYLLLLGTEVIFVGQSEDVRAKIDQHFRERVKVFDTAIYYPCSLLDLDNVEADFVERYAPRHNVQQSRRSVSNRARAMALRADVELALRFLRETDEDGIPARSLYQRVNQHTNNGTSAASFHRAMDLDGRARYFPLEGVYRSVITY